MNTLDLVKKTRGTNLGFIKMCLRILHSWRAHTLGLGKMPASVLSPFQALYLFNPLLLLPGSLARISHRRTSLFLIKLL